MNYPRVLPLFLPPCTVISMFLFPIYLPPPWSLPHQSITTTPSLISHYHPRRHHHHLTLKVYALNKKSQTLILNPNCSHIRIKLCIRFASDFPLFVLKIFLYLIVKVVWVCCFEDLWSWVEACFFLVILRVQNLLSCIFCVSNSPPSLSIFQFSRVLVNYSTSGQIFATRFGVADFVDMIVLICAN